ncbi:MAG: lactate utilization protein B [Porticoccaceae bacterium]
MTEPGFILRSREALADPVLQSAMDKARPGFVRKRSDAIARVANFSELRDKAREVRQRSLRDLDVYLGIFERRVTAAGGHVHWASSTDDLRRIVLDIAKAAGARTATKGKSMIAEEAELNQALEAAGISPRETDLGEYIIQLAGEPPSHIVAPALHKTRPQIADLFRTAHALGERQLETVQDLVDEARRVIRSHYLEADIGITGANILIADTGTMVLCTNEGNGDLTASLPDTHIVTTSIDKVVASWDDASAILRVLARSATGQAITTYTSFYGPRQPGDLDGPSHFHVVLLDNRRSSLLGSEYQEMLQCIKCGACMNHCPVYQAVGGHSYDSVYPGPMGAVLTPLLRGERGDYLLPHASTFCGRCEEVCPVRIPLPSLLRKLREKDVREHHQRGGIWLIRFYVALARFPRLYRVATSALSVLSAKLAKRGKLPRLPGLGAWQRKRDMAAPQGASFQQQWRARRKSR